MLRSVFVPNGIVNIPQPDEAISVVDLIFIAVSVDSIAPSWAFSFERTETGPPLDRVIVFRSLLI